MFYSSVLCSTNTCFRSLRLLGSRETLRAERKWKWFKLFSSWGFSVFSFWRRKIFTRFGNNCNFYSCFGSQFRLFSGCFPAKTWEMSKIVIIKFFWFWDFFVFLFLRRKIKTCLEIIELLMWELSDLNFLSCDKNKTLFYSSK